MLVPFRRLTFDAVLLKSFLDFLRPIFLGRRMCLTPFLVFWCQLVQLHLVENCTRSPQGAPERGLFLQDPVDPFFAVRAPVGPPAEGEGPFLGLASRFRDLP